MVKLSAKETKWTSSEVRTRSTFLETLISKSDSRPGKLLGLSRNGPLVSIHFLRPESSAFNHLMPFPDLSYLFITIYM